MPAPSRFYRQHHDVEAPVVDALAFRPGWRKRVQLEVLKREGAITDPEYYAALAVRDAVERVASIAWPAPLWLGSASGGRGDHDLALVHRLDDLGLLRVLRAALGGWAWGLVEACVVDDLTWTNLGRRLDVDPKTARARAVLAIKRLAQATLDMKNPAEAGFSFTAGQRRRG